VLRTAWPVEGMRGLIGPAGWAVALFIAQAVLVSPALSQVISGLSTDRSAPGYVRAAVDTYLASYAPWVSPPHGEF